MKSSRLGWAWCLVLGLAGAAHAASVAVVNIAEVSEKYQRTADLEARFEQVRQKLNEERESLRGRIERATRSLQEELKPGTSEFRERRKELAMLEAQLQYFVESEGKQIEQELAESLRSIFNDIHAMVRVIAEEKAIDIVLVADRMPEGPAENTTQVRQQIVLQKVLYWSPQVDITADVVSRLNQRYQAQAPQPKP